jgi:hypothetical protein
MITKANLMRKGTKQNKRKRNEKRSITNITLEKLKKSTKRSKIRR